MGKLRAGRLRSFRRYHPSTENGVASGQDLSTDLGPASCNAVFGTMTQLGIGAGYHQILTVRGRKTGQLRSTPVDVVDIAGYKWLVAPYGVSSWVRNVRAAGEVSLTRRQHTERYWAEEVTGVGAVPVLRTYIGRRGWVFTSAPRQ